MLREFEDFAVLKIIRFWCVEDLRIWGFWGFEDFDVFKL